MKKIFALILALALLICAPACLADDNGRWYSLDDDGKTLTVRLDANATTGYFWTCSMTEEGIIEMVSEDYIEDEHDEGMAGVGGQYVAVFKAIVPEDGDESSRPVSLVFTYARATGDPLYTAILDLDVYNCDVICVDNDLNEAEDGDTDRSGCELTENIESLKKHSLRF